MRQTFPIYLIVTLLMASSLTLKATHIVGGEMNYTCLGNDQYEITLTIFRDCFNGDPNAWFDNPASIGVFDRNNELLQEILIPLMNNDTLNPILSGECFVIPRNVCVHTSTYRTTISLPPLIGGYQLAYQRCCRNQTIVNIVEPLATGATYGVTISEAALLECNSNPKFQEWPPLYICVNEPIFFDQSAIDIDGDSIVYRLCTPLQGANQAIPQPQPPNPPPYLPITWVDPPYNVNNMLNGAPGDEPLRINSATGLLTGLPNTIGQFVVGICVEEYRNGLLISTTRRDFQYNVGICGESVSSFFAPEVQCDDLSVQFDNTSEGADDYLWIFGELENPLGTSTDRNPFFTFPDTGTYLVTLIAEPNETCRDTFSKEIQLKTNTLVADFELVPNSCSDTLFLEVQDLSTDTSSMIVDWLWHVLPDGNVFSGQNPSLFTTSAGEVTVELIIMAANGCQRSISRSINSNAIQAVPLQDSIQICQGNAVRLGSLLFPNYSFEWMPKNSLDNPLLPNPLASPTTTTTYVLSVSNEGECFWQDSVVVEVVEIDVGFPADTTICDPSLWLTVEGDSSLLYGWSLNSSFDEIIGDSDSILVTPQGFVPYYLRVQNELGCRLDTVVNIQANGIDLKQEEVPIVCEGDTLSVTFMNADQNDILETDWRQSDFLLSENGLSAIVLTGQGGENYFVLEASNQFGCVFSDSILVQVIDTSEAAAFFTTTQCSGLNVNFSSDSPNAPFFIWDFGDPADATAVGFGKEAYHEYAASGTYDVRIIIDTVALCRDTFVQQITVGEPEIAVDFSWNVLSCADTTLIVFEDQSRNIQSLITDWIWQIGDTIITGEPTFELLFTNDDVVDASLEIISSDGCRDTLQQPIDIPLIEVLAKDTLQLCFGETVPLNPTGNPSLTYQWSPVMGLDDSTAPNPMASPLNSTLYEVTITDAVNDCRLEQAVFVEVSPEIEYEMPPDQTICEESFELTVSTDQDVQVTWASDPDFLNPISLQDSVRVRPVGAQNYYLRLTNEFGCTLEDQLSIVGAAIRLELEGEATICIGDTATIFAQAIGAQNLSFQWTPESAIIGPANRDSILVNPLETTTYQLRVSNIEGCELDTFATVRLFNFIPPLAIEADMDTVLDGGSTQLLATQNETYIYQWESDPTLDVLNTFDPIASPLETTTYQLVIRDQNGCINEASITVFVFSPECRTPFIYVPNAFTPNGDGRNDDFRVYGAPIDELQLLIYDRWGEKIFESDDPTRAWDGTFGGKQLPSDVYAYYVRIKCFNGEEYRSKGNVTLIR